MREKSVTDKDLYVLIKPWCYQIFKHACKVSEFSWWLRSVVHAPKTTSPSRASVCRPDPSLRAWRGRSPSETTGLPWTPSSLSRRRTTRDLSSRVILYRREQLRHRDTKYERQQVERAMQLSLGAGGKAVSQEPIRENTVGHFELVPNSFILAPDICANLSKNVSNPASVDVHPTSLKMSERRRDTVPLWDFFRIEHVGHRRS